MSLQNNNRGKTIADEGFMKRKIITFFSSNTFSYMIPISIFSCFLIIPCFYISQYYFPDSSEVKYSEGKFIYKKSGKNGFYAGIEREGKSEFFSCVSIYGIRNNCELDRDFYRSFPDDKNPQDEAFIAWKGKPAKITWFNQKLNVFSSQRRLVELVVDGEVVISIERVRKNIERTRDGWLSRMMLNLSGLLLLLLLIRKFFLKDKTKESEHE